MRRRRSFRKQKPIAAPTSVRIGRPSASSVIGSPDGVATAAKTKTPKMMPRHQDASRLPLSTPTMFRATRINGVRKPSLNTSAVRRKKDRYRLTST